MAIQDDKTILSKQDLKEYHNRILPYLGGNMMMSTNNSDYFSTDEKVIGVWTDGKPLYQRSFDIGTESSPGMKNYTLNVANVDYVMLDFSHSFLYSKSESVITETLPLMIVWDTVSSGGFTLAPQTNSVKLNWYRKAWQHLPAIVTIQYTKTTDTASTALTTPGAYDINFPNTWPENKEIYFGNGLYGFRKKGTAIANTLASGGLSLVSNVPKTAICWKKGGMIDMSGTNGTNWYDIAGSWPNFDPLITNTDNIFRFYCKNNQGYTTESFQFDIWITYTK